jgi:predicted adenylyl cyclase CyaB
MRFSGRDSRAAERVALGADTMARNVEIKAKIEEVAPLLERVQAVSESGPLEIDQDDTFFRCPSGRLKLRELSSSEGQHIFYERPDCAGPKESRYFICPTTQPGALRETLTLALGIVGRVRKRRLSYLVRNTRIHIDEVEGLGHFLELEVVLADGESVEAGQAVAHDLRSKLGISAQALIAGAYVDMPQSTPDTSMHRAAFGGR